MGRGSGGAPRTNGSASGYLAGNAANDASAQNLRLSDAERTSLNWYASNGHDKINAALRGNATMDQGTLERTTDNIDRIMNRARTKENIIVHRGMLIEDAAGRAYLASLKPGTVYTDKGYVSTSTSKQVAGNFGYGSRGLGGTTAVSVSIRVPRGTKAIHMSSARPNQGTNESEVLLARGLRYRVVSRKTTPGHVRVTLEVVK